MKKATCSTPGCGKDGYCRGMCSSCYGKAYRSGTIQLQLPLDRHSLTEVDRAAKRAVCSICGPVAIRVRSNQTTPECMTMRRKHRRARSSARRTGGKTYPAGPESGRRWRIKAKYGMTLEDVQLLEDAQGGVCAICSAVPDGKLNVDHDHETGKVRGLLCRSCNLALGFFRDSRDLLEAASAYLGEPPAQR